MKDGLQTRGRAVGEVVIRAVPVPARRLLTLGEDHPVWGRAFAVDGVVWAGPDGFDVEGALVRLRPPPDAGEVGVAEVVQMLERAGAARVKIVLRSSVPEVIRRTDVGPSLAPKLSHREAVLAAAAEARSSDPAALRTLLEGILDEEGM